MNDRRGLAAALGFAFVAAWIGFNFGYAILCLVGAAVFWAVVSVLEGTLDLGEVQQRLTGRDADLSPGGPATPRHTPHPRARVR